VGLLDTIFQGTSSKDSMIRSQAKKIIDLEDTVKTLTVDITDLKKRLTELADVVSYLSSAQQQLAHDMGIIYENVRAVGDVLADHSEEAEDKYFSWRWGLPDDDDDLPN
jgi:hypothetical protein